MKELTPEFIAYVRNSIDIMVSSLDDEYPVMEGALTETNIASAKELKALERQGMLKMVQVDVPSKLVEGSTIKMKAYYTERRVPTFVQEMKPAVL